jgi:CheY-like chemotaxis protein
LQQILLNLVVNAEQAIRHGSGTGSIRIRTRRIATDRVAIEVMDNGPGIPPEILPRIFDAFYTTKPPGVGTGLGLPIAHGIARDHGGRIAVESRPGSGATFTLELPIAPAPPLAARSIAAQKYPAPPSAIPFAGLKGYGERILIIDDEPAVARLIEDVLGERGYRADVALESREGMKLIARNSYDLVLCDLRMPHLDGRSLFRQLQRKGHPLCRRFVFMTGDVLTAATAEFLKTSGASYLAKPFLIEELRSAVRQALSQSNPILPLVAAAGRVELGRGEQKMRRAHR